MTFPRHDKDVYPTKFYCPSQGSYQFLIPLNTIYFEFSCSIQLRLDTAAAQYRSDENAQHSIPSTLVVLDIFATRSPPYIRTHLQRH
eukprot:3774162-Ditylum_brightwellii.AAC.1